MYTYWNSIIRPAECSLQKLNGLYEKSINLFLLRVETFSPYCY